MQVKILMVYLMEFHCGKKAMFRYGVGGGFIPGLLLGSDVGFEHGIIY